MRSEVGEAADEKLEGVGEHEAEGDRVVGRHLLEGEAVQLEEEQQHGERGRHEAPRHADQRRDAVR